MENKGVKLMQIIIMVLVAALCITSTLLFQTKTNMRRNVEIDKEHTKYWRSLTGATCLWPGSHGKPVSYNLKSWDGGETWVAVEYDKEWRMKVLGDAEVIFPGLVKNINAVEVLLKAAQNGTPLTIPKDQKLFKNSGFEVK